MTGLAGVYAAGVVLLVSWGQELEKTLFNAVLWFVFTIVSTPRMAPYISGANVVAKTTTAEVAGPVPLVPGPVRLGAVNRSTLDPACTASTPALRRTGTTWRWTSQHRVSRRRRMSSNPGRSQWMLRTGS
jgi:hypothetical protein